MADAEIVADAVCGVFRDEDGAVLIAFSADDKFATIEIN